MRMESAVAMATACLALGCTDRHDRAGVPQRGAGHVDQIQLIEAGGGARFDALGRSLSGGQALTPVAGYNQFWFAWSVFNHGSAIFGGGTVATAPLEGDGECAVPCEQIRAGCPGKDCIPALTAPSQVSPGQAGSAYITEGSWVVGVAIGGEARAYPHNILWWHEIVNDVVGGVPIAVTHCPLTFSTLGHDPTGFVAGQTVELGVSGKLFNSNLVFYNRTDDTYFSQLLGVGTKGAALGDQAPRAHVFEMSWGAWRRMHPNTTLLSDQTGHARDYERYPYGDYFVDDADTFAPTTPPPDGRYPNKTLTYGVRLDGEAKAYPYPELARFAEQIRGASAPPVGLVMDDVGGHRIAVVFDLDAGYVQAFDRTGLPDLELSL